MILPEPESSVMDPRRVSPAEEQAATWQAIANLSPAALHGRLSMARSALLPRFPDTEDRLAVERCLQGWYDA